MSFSRIDTNVQLTEHSWAVTLLKEAIGNHALLAIEGIKDGSAFLKIAHLTGALSSKDKNIGQHGSTYFFSKSGRVKVSDITDKPCHYGAKTETWQRSRDKVDKLLNEAIREAALYASETVDNPTPFSIFGRKSIFTRPVKQIEITNPELKELKETDPRLFNSIYEESEDSSGGYLAKKTAVAILMFPVPVLNVIVGFTYLQVFHRSFTIEEDDRKRLVGLVKEHVNSSIVTPNSCFTWAREKLRMVDVELEEKGIDFIIAATPLYTKKS